MPNSEYDAYAEISSFAETQLKRPENANEKGLLTPDHIFSL